MFSYGNKEYNPLTGKFKIINVSQKILLPFILDC